MRLHEIPEAYRLVEARIEEAEGELSPELEQALDTIEGALEDKVDAIGVLATEAKGRAAFFAEEAKRLAERSRVESNRADNLREYLKKTLEAMGREKVQGKRFTVRIQRNGIPSITFDVPAERLPEPFRILTYVPDRDAVKAAWKAGETLPDGVSVVLGRHLRIV